MRFITTEAKKGGTHCNDCGVHIGLTRLRGYQVCHDCMVKRHWRYEMQKCTRRLAEVDYNAVCKLSWQLVYELGMITAGQLEVNLKLFTK